MTRVCITGGAGFIASHVADFCLVKGWDVTIIDDLSGGSLANVPNKATFHQCDICDHERITQIFRRGNFDYVYHLAAYAAEGLSSHIKRFNYTNNTVGSMNIINECVKTGVKCLVFTSSIAVYGHGQSPMTEDMIPSPCDSYGISKWAVELDLKASHEHFGLDYIIFRPHNVVGPRQNLADKFRNVAAIFMNQLMNNQPLTIFGDGYQTRAFTYIDDVAPIIADSPTVMRAYNKTFNIGADQPVSVNDLAYAVAEAMGVADFDITHLPPRKEVVMAFSDHKLLKSTFTTPPATPLKDGLKVMAKWAQAAGPQTPTKFSNIEITKNLPPSWIQ